MKRQKELYGSRILLAFFIATFIFVNSFLISYGVSYSKSKNIAQSQEEIYFNLLNFQLENYLSSSVCTSFSPYQVSDDLDSMGSLLGILEERFGKYDEKVLEQKKIYSLIELQHYFLVNNYNLECDDDFPVILFFYSNLENYQTPAERIGFILETYKNENKNTMIYSFDYDLDFNVIALLKEKHNLTQPNSIIINDNIKIENLQNIEEISKNI